MDQPRDPRNLGGKIAVIVGGASGIGEAVAIGAAAQGATVAIFDANGSAAVVHRAKNRSCRTPR